MAKFAICIDNASYEVSPERRKLYQLAPDVRRQHNHQLRVADESGEDYLYPESCFVPVTLPERGRAANRSYGMTVALTQSQATRPVLLLVYPLPADNGVRFSVTCLNI